MTPSSWVAGLILGLVLAGEAPVGSCFQHGALPALKGFAKHRATSPLSAGRLRGGVRMQATGTDPKLKERIANFYDQSSELWENVWGEHMHMGTPTPSPQHAKTQSLALPTHPCTLRRAMLPSHGADGAAPQGTTGGRATRRKETCKRRCATASSRAPLPR